MSYGRIQVATGDLVEYAGQSSEIVLYVDCCNRFDPHRLYRAAGNESVLDRVIISRPFTLYQLRELVENKLEKTIQESGARTLLVAGYDSYETDNPLDEREYDVIKESILEKISKLTRDYQLHTVISHLKHTI